MSERRVAGVRRDKEGTIDALCGSWGLVSAEQAMEDITSGSHSYYVEELGARSEVEVVTEDDRKRLQAASDPGADNHLDNLPGC